LKKKYLKKMRKSIKSVITLLLALAIVKVGSAQGEDGTLERDSFVIIKEYVPTLSQAAKIRVNPQIDDSHHLDLNLKYQFLEKNLASSFEPEPIKAATLKGEPLNKLRRSYLILGYGNYNTPLAELYIGQLREKNSSYSVFAKHHSSAGLKDVENSNFSNNELGFNGNIYTRKFTYGTRLNYKYDHLNYYGFHRELAGINVSDAEKNEDIMQFYNNFNVAVNLANNQRDTIGIRHFSELSFNTISDRYGANENRVIISEELSILNNVSVYTFDWVFDYNKYSVDEELNSNLYDSENSVLKLEPGIELKGDKWVLDAELKFAAELMDETEVHVYPHADFRYQLVKSIIIPYAGLTGNLRRNTYGGFVADNPFIGPAVPLVNTSEDVRFYAGIGGHLSKNTSFDVSLSQSNLKEMPLYVKDTNSREMRSFTLQYDDMTITTATVELIYEPLTRWKVALKGDYFKYETQEALYAWHMPDYRISLLTNYNLADKIIVDLMIFGIGQQKARLYDSRKYENIDGTVDVNLGFEYRYTRKVGMFLDFNNIASIQYEKWQDYPTQAFNVLGGFKFSF
jgi:hypothetical protein